MFRSRARNPEVFEISDCGLVRGSRNKTRQQTNGHSVSKKTSARKHTKRKDPPSVPAASILRHNPPLEWAGLKNLDSSSEDLANIYIWLLEIAADFESGLCSRGIMQGLFAVPIHNVAGELLAYCGIDLDEHSEARLKFPPKYDSSIDLFNIHREPSFVATYEKNQNNRLHRRLQSLLHHPRSRTTQS